MSSNISLTMTAGLGHGWGGRGDPDAERLHRLKGQGGDERLRDEGRPSGSQSQHSMCQKVALFDNCK